MEQQVARDLATSLTRLEQTRVELEGASDEEVVAKSIAYQAARKDAMPAFEAAQRAYEAEGAADDARPPTTSQPEPAADIPTEASPGVNLVQPPGVVVDAASLDRFGPLVEYRSKEDPTGATFQATPYAFGAGTAIATGTDQGTVATAQASRVLVEGEILGVVANDVFNQTFEPAEGTAPTKTTPEEAPEPVGETEPEPGPPAAEEPVPPEAEAPGVAGAEPAPEAEPEPDAEAPSGEGGS